MKPIGYAVAILALAASAQASVLGLTPAAEPPEYYAVTITASPAVPITNAFLIYGNDYVDDNNYYSQRAYAAIPLGTLAAATSAAPDVLTVNIPQLWFNDPAYPPQPVLPDRAGYSIEGLYTAGGVALTDPGYGWVGGPWPFPDTSEATVANALASGNANTVVNVYEVTDYITAQGFGQTQALLDYSDGTANGNIDAVVSATPVPEPATATLMLVGAVSLLRRRR